VDDLVAKSPSNEEKISSSFRRVYFVLSFSFKIPIYVDIMRVFKVETKVKRSRPNGEIIISSLLILNLKPYLFDAVVGNFFQIQ
jgi:hypothetical protein